MCGAQSHNGKGMSNPAPFVLFNVAAHFTPEDYSATRLRHFPHKTGTYRSYSPHVVLLVQPVINSLHFNYNCEAHEFVRI